MTMQSQPNPRIGMLIDTFAAWLKHRRELNEMRQMDRSDFDRIASDLRVSPGELDTLVRNGPHVAEELPYLLRALGIDEASLARAEPVLLRDMERVCAVCRHKRQCERDLIAGTSAEHYHGYCPNAATIDGLDQPVD
jgi:transcriptional regulator with XRE-family HTH domain